MISADFVLTRSIRDSETSIDFVQGSSGSRREWVKENVGKRFGENFSPCDIIEFTSTRKPLPA